MLCLFFNILITILEIEKELKDIIPPTSTATKKRSKEKHLENPKKLDSHKKKILDNLNKMTNRDTITGKNNLISEINFNYDQRNIIINKKNLLLGEADEEAVKYVNANANLRSELKANTTFNNKFVPFSDDSKWDDVGFSSKPFEKLDDSFTKKVLGYKPNSNKEVFSNLEPAEQMTIKNTGANSNFNGENQDLFDFDTGDNLKLNMKNIAANNIFYSKIDNNNNNNNNKLSSTTENFFNKKNIVDIDEESLVSHLDKMDFLENSNLKICAGNNNNSNMNNLNNLNANSLCDSEQQQRINFYKDIETTQPYNGNNGNNNNNNNNTILYLKQVFSNDNNLKNDNFSSISINNHEELEDDFFIKNDTDLDLLFDMIYKSQKISMDVMYNLRNKLKIRGFNTVLSLRLKKEKEKSWKFLYEDYKEISPEIEAVALLLDYYLERKINK